MRAGKGLARPVRQGILKKLLRTPKIFHNGTAVRHKVIEERDRRERIAIRVCKRIGTADRLYYPERFPSAAE